MTKKKRKYDSSRALKNYTFHPGKELEFIWDALPGDCQLYALDHRTTVMLRRMIQVIPKYYWMWNISGPQSEWDQETLDLWEDINTFTTGAEVCLMSGCSVEDLIGALDGVKTAIEGIDAQISVNLASPCCGSGGQTGSGGAGGTEAPPDPGVGHPDTQDPIPDGFNSWDDYFVYKCGMANTIITELSADIAATSIISVGALVLGEMGAILAVALATPIPGDELVILAAIIIQAVAVGVIFAQMTTLVALNREDLVCALYTGQHSAEAILNFDAKINELVDADALLGLPVVGHVAKEFFKVFSNADSFNRMFTNIPGNYPIITPCTCSCAAIHVEFATDLGNDIYQAGQSTDPADPDWYIQVFWNVHIPPVGVGVSSTCGPQIQLDTLLPDGGFTPVAGDAYRVSSGVPVGPGCVGNDLWCDDVAPTLPIPLVRSITLKSSTPFTATVIGS